MKGTIRFLLGLLVIFAAASADIATSNTQIAAVAAVGLLLMLSGAAHLRNV